MILVKKLRSRKGFTMIELLTSVAITAVIITVLIGMTRVAMDAWKDSQDKTKASRQAKEALETLAKDLEGIVIRSGNDYEWAFVKSESTNQDGPSASTQMSNPTEILFFSGATDRYDGKIGSTDDKGGDVSTVSYRIVYQDQLNPADDEFPVFALYRNLVNPDETFNNYLSQQNLMTGGVYNADDTKEQNNFLVENIFDLTITFIFEYQDASGQTITKRVPITADGTASDLRIFGDRIEVGGSVLNDPSGNKITRLAGAELSILVLTDSGLNVLRNRNFSTDEEFSKFLDENGYHYSKSVILPRP